MDEVFMIKHFMSKYMQRYSMVAIKEMEKLPKCKCRVRIMKLIINSGMMATS